MRILLFHEVGYSDDHESSQESWRKFAEKVDAIHEYLRLSMDDVGYWWPQVHH